MQCTKINNTLKIADNYRDPEGEEKEQELIEIKMMSKMNTKKWVKWMLVLFVPLVFAAVQAFAQSELIIKTNDSIPAKYQENKDEEWIAQWTSENIGKGFFQPAFDSGNASQKPNNVLEILMNWHYEFLIENQLQEEKKVKQIVKNYLNGINPDGKKGPDYIEKEIPVIGKMKVSKGIITYRHDLASSSEMVNFTLRSVGEACLEVRKEKAQSLFGKDYFDLDEEKQSAINKVIPVWFFYEYPKSPTPSVWLPYDKKPSKPDPFKITFKGNGIVIVENHKFNTFKEFEENLKYWNEELDKFNKGRRSTGFYRAHVTYEDISRSEQKNIEYLLFKNNVRTASAKSNVGIKSTSILLKPDKDGPDLEEIRKKAEKDLILYKDALTVSIQYVDGVTKEQVKSVMDVYSELGIKITEVSEYEYKKPAQPLCLLRLYPKEIQNVLSEPIPINEVSKYVENWLKTVGSNYSASIYVYENVSEERIQQLKEAMQNGGIKTEIIVKEL
jgi:hypothetical protein